MVALKKGLLDKLYIEHQTRMKKNIIQVFILFILIHAVVIKADAQIEILAPGVEKISSGVADQFTPYRFCEKLPFRAALGELPAGKLPFNINEIKIKINTCFACCSLAAIELNVSDGIVLIITSNRTHIFGMRIFFAVNVTFNYHLNLIFPIYPSKTMNLPLVE